METKDLINIAEEYTGYEKNKLFSSEVEDLIKAEDFDELNDRFFKELDFGTGGIRGVIGGGYNRINPYVIQKTTQGLANYINKAVDNGTPSVAVAYDSRRYSDLFAKEAALVLCANNIKVFLFTSLRPTPELSFAVRQLSCTAGIVLTASHNPAEYNGYKVSWSDGGQIVAPHDKLIIEEVKKAGSDIRIMDEKEALEKGLLKFIDSEVDEPYMNMVDNCFLRKELIKEKGKDLKVVYTPLHGAGKIPVEKALSRVGINVLTVPQQADPDGNFPTVEFPNPEEASAMKMAIELAKIEKADLVMGTDPDSDRIGIAVPDGGDYVLINGNQLGSMLAYYILSSLKESGSIPAKGALIKTIVTTELQRKIGKSFGVKVYDVLTGFKWIAKLIADFETTGENYIFGGEESYGFLVSDKVRDKDAVSAAALTAEMALYNISEGRSVLEYLDSIYEKYGYYKEDLISKTFKGEKGLKIMSTLMDNLRNSSPSSLGSIKVAGVKDYNKGVESEGLKLPLSNVLQFTLEEGSIVTVRPSGTEPKIKFYISCCEESSTELNKAKDKVNKKVSDIKKDINDIISRI